MAHDVQDGTMEPIVDGMIRFLQKNLVAHTPLVASAAAGATEIRVETALRFDAFDDIVLMDDEHSFNSDTQQWEGVEFATISPRKPDSHVIRLSTPLTRAWDTSKNARIQKVIRRAILFDNDILYGDRQVIGADFVAVCVEPDTRTSQWLALHGLLGHEFKLNIIVYVKAGAAGADELDSKAEEMAIRICNSYTDAISSLLNHNIHLDVAVDEVPLLRDAYPGDTSVFVASSVAHLWPPDCESAYAVQDYYGTDQEYFIVPPPQGSSSSSSSSSSADFDISTSSNRSSLTSESDSSSRSSSSSASTMTSTSSSTPSWTSASRSTSQSTSSSSTDETSTSRSSSSSMGTGLCQIFFGSPLTRHFRVSDGAVLRRSKRYFYDSLAGQAVYGTVQKGSAILKAGSISWFGKETQRHVFPQVGRG